jgi:hypothetical protein
MESVDVANAPLRTKAQEKTLNAKRMMLDEESIR